MNKAASAVSSQTSSLVSSERKLKEKRFICFLYRNLLKLCRCYDEHPALKFSLVNPRNTKSRNLITRSWTKTQLGQFILSQVYRDPKSFFHTPPGASFERICKNVFRIRNHVEDGSIKFTKNDAIEVCFGLQSEMNLNIEKSKKLMVVRKLHDQHDFESSETQPVEFSLVNTVEPKKFHILVSHPMLTDIVFERTCFVMTDNKQRVASILGKRAHELRRKKKRKKNQKQLLPSMIEEHIPQTSNAVDGSDSSVSTAPVSNSESSSVTTDHIQQEFSKSLEANIETFPNDPNLLKSKIPLTITPVMPLQTHDTFEYDDDNNFSNNPEDDYDPNDEYDDSTDSNEYEYEPEDTINDEMLSTLEEEGNRYLENLLKELEARQRLASWRKGQLSSEIQHGTWLVVTVDNPSQLLSIANSKPHWQVWEYVVKRLASSYPELESWLDFPFNPPMK